MLKRSGFTLLELTAVVLIVGIIAAAASSRMVEKAAMARESTGRQSLQIVREAIELDRAQNGTYPGQSNNLVADLQPYLRGPFPKSPAGSLLATVKHVGATGITADPSPAHGWKYSRTSGEFIVNNGSATVCDPSVTFDQW